MRDSNEKSAADVLGESVKGLKTTFLGPAFFLPTGELLLLV